MREKIYLLCIRIDLWRTSGLQIVKNRYTEIVTTLLFSRTSIRHCVVGILRQTIKRRT